MPEITSQHYRASVLTGLKLLTTWGLKQCLVEHRRGRLLLDGKVIDGQHR